MSGEDNKATFRRFMEEGWDQGKLAVFDELVTPNWSFHDPAFPTVRTLADFQQWVSEVHNAFPNLHFTVEDVIAEGDQLASRWTLRGTNTGDIVKPMHIPATGKQIAVTGITFCRFAGGKISEIWNQTDNLGWLQQLGVIPMPQPVG